MMWAALSSKETSLRRLFGGGERRGWCQPRGRRRPPQGLRGKPRATWPGVLEAGRGGGCWGCFFRSPGAGEEGEDTGSGWTGALGAGSPASAGRTCCLFLPLACRALQTCSSGPTTRWCTGCSPLGSGITQETCRRAACTEPCWPWTRTSTTTRWPWSCRSPRRTPRWAALSRPPAPLSRPLPLPLTHTG